jgi:hypothetical protein
LDDRADGGTPNDPIIIQNYRGEKVEFRGGFKILDEVTDITFREAGSGEFYLDGSYALQIPDNDSPYLGTEPVVWVFGDRIRLEGLDMAKPQGWTNPNKAGTCVLMSPDRSVNSRPEDIKIIGNDIHHCGSGLPAPDSHGIYLAGINGAEIRDNLIWHNGENGIKFYPDSYKVVMEDNILYKNGRQIIWAGTGSSYPDNNVVRNNVIAFPGRSWNVYSYWRNMTTSARPKNNVVENNCLYTNLDYGAPDGLKRPTEGWTERNNVAANPKFIGNPPNGDFRMAADSPCHSVYSGRTQ